MGVELWKALGDRLQQDVTAVRREHSPLASGGTSTSHEHDDNKNESKGKTLDCVCLHSAMNSLQKEHELLDLHTGELTNQETGLTEVFMSQNITHQVEFMTKRNKMSALKFQSKCDLSEHQSTAEVNNE